MTHDGSHLQTHHDNISNVIARTSLDHYNNILPNKGKPTPNKEWTVYAAIVATTTGTFVKGVVEDTSNQGDCKVSNNNQSNGEEIRAWVVSSATGSKCTAINSCTLPLPMQSCKSKNSTMSAGDHEDDGSNDPSWKGMILHDSHAEVLARRGLLKVLWREIYMDLLKESQDSSEENIAIQSNEDKNPKLLLQRVSISSTSSSSTENNGNHDSENVISYQLNEKIQLHMYISDSPCGDASIYDIVPEYKTDQTSTRTTTFTGAKIILPQKPCTTARGERLDNFRPCEVDQDKVHIARETVQVVSALRLKSGRSNLPAHLRSMSMSCSDKLCKWMVLGLQGSGLLSNFVQKPIILSTVVVSHDVKACIKSQEEALRRAVVERANRTIQVASSKFSKENRCATTIPCYPLKVQVFVCHEIFPQSKAAAADAKAIKHGLKTKNKVDHSSLPQEVDEFPRKRKHGMMDDDSSRRNTNTSQDKPSSSPSGMSINWQCSLDEHMKSNNVELIVGAKGIKQGKRPKNEVDFTRLSSRLSRHSLLFDSLQCIQRIQHTGYLLPYLTRNDMSTILLGHSQHDSKLVTYQWTKTLDAKEDDPKKCLKTLVFQNQDSPLFGWVRSSKDHDFKCSHG